MKRRDITETLMKAALNKHPTNKSLYALAKSESFDSALVLIPRTNNACVFLPMFRFGENGINQRKYGISCDLWSAGHGKTKER